MARPKKIQANQVNGKINTLNQIFGDDGLGKYGTLDQNVYRERLDALDTSDLHLEATRNGIKPIHSRELIIKSLMSEFIKHKNSYFGVDYANQSKQPTKKELEEYNRLIRS